uniref:Dipeptidyl-peptidase 4 n=1 Tax=Lates calcarifer TaxID=8187 RepID=A0A4W6BYB4_LATCA
MVGSVLQILTCQCCVGVCSTGSFLERFVTFCVFNPEQVSVGKVLLGVFGVAVVVILIAVPTAIFLNEEKGGNQRSFTLEDVFNSSLRPKSFGMRWISGLEEVFVKSLFSFPTQNEKKAYDYQLSADRKYVAFMSNHSKAFVWENNVYIKTSPGSPAQQITFNGKENFILNGIPDWVYEEEMFSSSQGLWWSPGGKYVAYAEFNDTGVHNIEYSWYGENQYPSTVSIPYPKPGTPNPVVKLFVVDTDNTTKITEVVVPASFSASEHYLATVTWVTDNRIAVQWLKRVQNHLILQIYNLSESRWDPIEVKHCFSPPEPVFAEDKASYYLLMSDTKKYKHIHHVVGVGSVITLPEVLLPSHSYQLFHRYYSSNEDGGKPGGRNVYKWTKQGTKCLTCTLHGEKCQYNSAYFSHNASFYRLSCSDFYIFTFVELKVLENNTAFSNLISDLQMPSMRRGTIKVAGYNLWYQMFLPPGFDESKKYPLLIDVYAGPCSQKADFTYRVSWSTYLASTEKIIVASFDGRGSGFQGDQLMHEIYKRLGTYEVEDQITAAKEFIKMGFIDKDRVAIWGWSYGGYVTSMALGAGSGVFKCGMAVAPVSKWVYYDSIYTERYMMEPSENPDAYLNSTVTARAKNFHSVQYLLVHGTADDNVHFQQAAEISEALVEEQVDFEAMWYTDKDHGLEGSAHQHVYTHMSHFLLRCFA